MDSVRERLISLLCEFSIKQKWLLAVANLAKFLIDNGVTIPVRCKDCVYRGNPDACPMCYEEQVEWDDDGYIETDWILHDSTQDDGFCEGGERRTE